MSLKEEICARCGKPSNDIFNGSLTQWVILCRCDVLDRENASDIKVEMCLNCGKRIGEGRAGTFTQWIFRADICNCIESKPVEKTIRSLSEEEFKNASIALPDINEIEVDENLFPTDRFTPIEILSSTYNSTVYLSVDKLLGTRVAIKSFTSYRPEDIVTFQMEAKALSALSHEGIVKVLDFAEKNGAPYMVMEYIDGITVRQFLQSNKTLSADDTVEVISSLCQILSYCHSKNILHRDIKPENILLVSDRQPLAIKLVDFGLAFTMDATSKKGDSHSIAGTPLYMAPEVGKGDVYDVRSEIYSLGCVMFELLTGEVPYDAKSPLKLLKLHAEASIPKLSSGATGEELDKRLEEIVHKCLAKNPNSRFQSMDELNSELKKIAVLEEVDQEYPDDKTGEPAIEAPQFKQAEGKFPIVLTFLVVIFIGCSIYFMAHNMSSTNIESIMKVKKPEKHLVEITEEIQVKEIEKQASNQTFFSFAFQPVYRKPLKLVAKYDSRGKLECLRTSFRSAEDLELLKDCHFNQIAAAESNLNDEHLRALLKMKHLVILKASFTNITAVGIKLISDYKNFQNLKLDGMVDDQGLTYLSTMPNLKSLSINSCPITDDGLAKMKSCKSLSKLFLAGCKQITPVGINKLKRALPNCVIVH